ncbi:MAG: type II CRISPR RNA-guided endonuclease Cas9 [Proteocatella sp.]
MKNDFEKYYLGFDIGTNSLGWAVTDLDYNLKKFNGKAMWGSHSFKNGSTAEKRRLHRSARRRQQRNVQRIKLLQEIFCEEISKIDMGFYMRMQDSKYYIEDKKLKDKYSIFSDNGFTDIEYHKQFPTIYHLRKKLIEGNDEYDIRLIYLAIHNIIKNRGHFLFEGRSMDNITSFEPAFNDFKETLIQEIGLNLECKDIVKMQDILKSKNLGINEKKKQLKLCFETTGKQQDTFMALISGAKVKLSDLFDDEKLKDEEISDICFNEENCEEKMLNLESIIADKVICIQRAKAIFDWAMLEEIRKGNKYLSFSKVSDYEKHHTDLERLKDFVKNECPEKYKEIFSRNDVEGNYASYVKISKFDSKKQIISKYCSREDFYKYLKKQLPKVDNKDYKYILEEIEKGSFIPKQTNKNNGIIPYQMHLEELVAILENSSGYLEFLNKEDKTGYTAKEKIIKLLTFRIPYYVGPLNPAHQNQQDLSKGNSWIVKRLDQKITPWNFETVVNEEASAERFIRRMTNKCTYLSGEDVLPKNSLLYSEFMVLNELNNVKINGEGISVDLKNEIYRNLFQKGKKVTGKQLEKYLITEGITGKNDEITGFDKDFKNTLNSHADFNRILGGRFTSNKEMIEEIILWICLFGENKKMLTAKISQKYGKELSTDEIKAMSNLKYSGWGRFSQKFLTELYHHKGYGEVVNIITMLKESNENLMQLLSSKYEFVKAVETYNKSMAGMSNAINYEMLEDLYVSPAVRRSIWQTLNITKEILKINKNHPEKIFIEVAREEGEKTRTKSRKTQLLDLYKNCEDEKRDWIKEIEKEDESKFRSDKLYLYYTQMGKCMYTGDDIALGSLFDNNIYDIDHIYPRSKTKDDSLENKVLVHRTSNTDKTDVYPIDTEIQRKRKSFWNMLLEKGYIGSRKYERLTRVTEFSDSELAEFIARQLVETRQSTKAVAQILNQVFPKTEIVYSKAGNVSDFRQKFDIVKVRDINDYHHANDAYLNVVVGNVYNTKFTNNPVNYVKNKENRKYSLNKVLDFDVKKNEQYAWKTGKGGTISKVKKTLSKNNILFTRHSYTKKGGLFDQNIMKAGKGQLPVKSSDGRLTGQTAEEIISKYGGYNNVAVAYFVFVEHIKKGKIIRSIESVPVYRAKEIEENKQRLFEYFEQTMGLEDPKILIKKIKIDTLFDIDGFRMHISGKTGNQLIFKGANQLCISKESQEYLKRVMKYVERVKLAKKEIPITSYDKLNSQENLKIYDIYLYKLKNTVYQKRLSSQISRFEEGRDIFIALTLENQCKFLANAINLFKCNSVAADLSLINGPKSAGIIVMNNKIDNNLNIKIINQSLTGLFEKTVDFKKI